MAVKPVLALPEKVLQQVSVPLAAFDSAKGLAEDLVDTMYASPGCVGLAAPQIGVSVRAFCIDVTGHKKAKTCHGLVVLFDPKITSTSGNAVAREGCMSVPHLTGDVPRAESLVITGMSADGEEITFETDAFEARAVQHEVDHLDGLLFLDRVQSAGGIFPRKVYR